MFVDLPDPERGRGFRLYVERRGRGPTVLYLGGSGRRLADRPNVFDTPLAAACDVVAHDQRGAGRSGAPDGEWAVVDFARDASALAAALGIERCSVVGVSFGGMVAQELAIDRPGLVDRLVLVATSPGGAGGSSYPIDELLDLVPRARFELELELADTRCDAAWRATEHELVERLWRDSPYASGAAPVSDRELRQLRARRAHDCWDRLGSIAAPTLVCGGLHDGVAPLDRSRALADRLPRGRLAVFEGGHQFVKRDPAAWPAIVDFLLG